MNNRRRVLDRQRLLAFIDGLDGGAGALTCYWPPGTPAGHIESLLESTGVWADAHVEIAKHAAGSPTGSVIFQGHARLTLVLPPFPLADELTLQSIETGPLRSSLARDYRIGIVLVRLGSYAVGVCEDEKLVSGKVGTGLVHGRHRQGGSSAHRFERHRDKQIEYFLTRVCRHACEHLQPYVKSMDYLAYGGARTTILLLQKRCDFLSRLDVPALPPLLDIPEPRQAVLEEAVKHLYSGTVIEWTLESNG